MSKPSKIVCRFAPSPTGLLHLGGARSALFNYLFARQKNGKIILRIEDTDKERSKKEYEGDILAGFAWLDIEFDETHRQSDRLEIHKKYLKNLLDAGVAYVSKEEIDEGNPSTGSDGLTINRTGRRRSEVIRFKNPRRRIEFNDLIKGNISFDTTELGDFVIAKSLDEPLFHLAVVVDDFEMGITHVIRGEDHISNTPRQILIQEAIGAPRPLYGHIPLILAPDRSKLSKRRHGAAVSVTHYREQGYLPQAVCNYLALLGWNPGDERELFSKEELISEFRLEKIQKSGAIFTVEKLNWMNKQYLLKEPPQKVLLEIIRAVDNSKELHSLALWQKEQLAPVLRDRIHYYGELHELLSHNEFNYLRELPVYKKEFLLWKKAPSVEDTRTHLTEIINILEKQLKNETSEAIKNAILPYAEEKGKGVVLWPLRFALSGREKSIDPFTLIAILGKDESKVRLHRALRLLE